MSEKTSDHEKVATVNQLPEFQPSLDSSLAVKIDQSQKMNLKCVNHQEIVSMC